MTRKPFSKMTWDTTRDEMRQIMIATARNRATITYSELCAALTTVYLHYHSPMVTRLLIEIGAEEMAAGRPVLPAVVVGKGSGMPGAGYFKAGGEQDIGDELNTDPVEIWKADLEAVFDYWSET